MKKKILIIEDDEKMHYVWDDMFEAANLNVEVIKVSSIEEARNAFNSNSDISAIVVDACVPGDQPNTMGLVKEIRKSFPGPMIAISNSDDFNNILMEAGCDYKAGKWELSQKVQEVFDFLKRPLPQSTKAPSRL